MLLAKYLGGSHLYNLNTPESDVDEREIFLNTEPAYILGTKRFDQEVRNNDKEDVHKVELRRFLELARKGNTQSVEVLFCKEESFEYIHPLMKELRENRHRLVDSDTLFKVISSFIHAQKYLIFDDKRKATEGSKRASKIEQYGYNPKAASTALRLAFSGCYFFRNKGDYCVEMHREYSQAASVKFNPEKWSAENIRNIVESWDKALKTSYEKSDVKTIFDEKFANDFLLKAYLPFLVPEKPEKKKRGITLDINF